MKRTGYTIILLLLFTVNFFNLSALAENKLSIPMLEIGAGKEALVPIYLSNDSQVVAVQFRLYLPAGFILSDTTHLNLSDRKTNHTVSIKRMGSNEYLIVLYSITNTPLRGSSGELLRLPVLVPDTCQTGNSFPFRFSEVILSARTGRNLESSSDPGGLIIMNSPRPDISIENVLANNSVLTPGKGSMISWTVKNVGNLKTSAGWSEQVSLVADNGETVYLGTRYYDQLLGPGASVNRQADFALSLYPGIEGNVKIVVKIIPNADLGELPAAKNNNTGQSVDYVTINRLLTFLILRNTVGENDASPIQCQLFRSGSRATEQTFTVTSTNLNRLTVPSTVSIPVNSSGTVFYIYSIDNNVVNADTSVVVTVSGNSYHAVSDTIQIVDNEIPTLKVTSSKIELSEGNAFTLSIERELVNAFPLKVSLTTNYDKRFTFTKDAVIPANEKSVTVPISVIDDAIPSLEVAPVFTAKSSGYLDGTCSVLLSDNDIPEISLTIDPDTVSESAGYQAAIGTVKRLGSTKSSITLKLTDNSKGSLYYASSSITLSPGESARQFAIGVVNNDLVDSSRTYTITAAVYIASCGCSATGTSAGVVQSTLFVLDDDGPALKVTSSQTMLPEGKTDATILTVTRNTSTVQPLTVYLTSDHADMLTFQSSITIPAGSISVSVPVSVKKNDVSEGNQTVIFSVTANGYTKGICWALITDQTLADASISLSALSRNSVITKDTLRVNLIVYNSGAASLRAGTVVDVYLTKDSIIESSNSITLLKTIRTTTDIAPGKTEALNTTISLPDLTGKYYVFAKVNQSQAQPELSFLDNVSTGKSLTILPAYTVNVSVDKNTYKFGEMVSFTGRAYAVGSSSVSNVSVDIYIINNGNRQTLSAKTDASGAFKVNFQPFSSQMGHFMAGGCYPNEGLTDELVAFDVFGLKRTSSDYLVWEVLTNEVKTGEIELYNPGNLSLTNLTTTILSDTSGYQLTFTPISEVAAQSTVKLKYTLKGTVASTASDYEKILFQVSSAEGASLDLSVYYYCRSPKATLKASMSSIQTTMTKGATRTYQFTISNTGKGASGKISVLIPTFPWMSLVTPAEMPSLAFGETATIILQLSPGNDMAVNVPITGTIGINCENGSGIPLSFNIETVSEQTGTLVVDVCDEFTYYTEKAPHVSGASVTVKHPYTNALIAQGTTDSTGLFTLKDLPEGFYSIVVTANKHDGYTNNVLVDPGKTTKKTVNLSFQAITYSWEVVETEVEDKYDIVTTVKFETNVPVPVVEVKYPDGLQYKDQLFNIYVTNKGLINAKDVTVNLPVMEGVHFTLLTENPIPILAPLQSMVIAVQMKVDDPTRTVYDGNGGQTGIGGGNDNGGLIVLPGNGDTDSDGDGTPDKHDPENSNPDIPYMGGGYSSGDHDSDGDGVPHSIDPDDSNPNIPNNGGADSDGDGIPRPYDPDDNDPNNPRVGGKQDCFTLSFTVKWSWYCGDIKWAESSITYKYGNCPQKVIYSPGGGGSPSLGGGGGGGGYGSSSSYSIPSLYVGCDPCQIEFTKRMIECGIGFIPIIGDLYGIATCAYGWDTKSQSEKFECVAQNAFSLAGGKVANVLLCWYSFMQPCTISNLRSLIVVGTTGISYIDAFQVRIAEGYEELKLIRSMQSEFLGGNSMTNCSTEEWAPFYNAIFSRVNPYTVITDASLLLPVKPAAVSEAELTHFIARWNNTIRKMNGEAIADTNFIDLDLISEYATQLNEYEAIAKTYGYTSMNELMTKEFEKLQKELNTSSSAVCASITLQFAQTMTMTRQAFRGTLTVFNGHETKAMENIALNLKITDNDGNVAGEQLFQINTESTDTLTAIDGTGTLKALGTGTATILFIPTKYAAPTVPKNYSFGGTLSYTDPFTGTVISRDLYPVTLTVKPSPDLTLTYFMQRDILGDDALTKDVVEPMVPAEFSLLINNVGAGNATKVNINSEQPKIIDNEKGLLIDFEIIGSSLNGAETSIGLTNIDFGTIPAKKTTYGQWWFTSTLLGHFVDYDIKLTHVTSFDNPNLSLVSDVSIHELVHTLSITDNSGATLAGFLVNDLIDSEDLPDRLYLSDGTQNEVTVASNAVFTKITDNSYMMAVIPSKTGWNYGVYSDPVNGHQALTSMVRQRDNKSISLKNIWQTDRTLRDGREPLYENRIHFADSLKNSTETYLLTFEAKRDNVLEVESFTGIPVDISVAPVTQVRVLFSRAIDTATFTNDDIRVLCQGTPQDVSGVTITSISDKEFLLNLSTVTANNGYYTLTVQTNNITDTENYTGKNGKTAGWNQYVGGTVEFTIVTLPTGSGIVTPGSGKQTFGSTVSLLAEPTTGYRFSKWTQNGELLSTENILKCTASESKTLVANFEIKYCDVILVYDKTMGAVTGASTGLFPYGSKVKLTAKPVTNFSFVGWKVDGIPTGTTDTLLISVSSATTIEAVFITNIVVIDYPLGKGWSWISSNLSGAPFRDPLQFLNPIKANTDKLVGFKTELVNDPLFGLTGGLNTIQAAESYKIKMKDSSFLQNTGIPYLVDSVTIDMQKGWNWIGYVPSVSLTPPVALKNLLAESNDVIKDQSDFSIFSGSEWIGTLKNMYPGIGYMYFASLPKTFQYATVNNFNAKIANLRSAQRIDNSYWSFDSRKYPNTMNIIARLYDEEKISETYTYTIGAFVNDECRGYGKYVGELLFITIYGQTTNEVISFRAYETAADRIWDVKETATFGENVLGNLEQPYNLHVDKNATGKIMDKLNYSIYPNPVWDRLYIKSEKLPIVGLRILRMDGRLMYISKDYSKEHGIDVSTLMEGSYILSITTENGTIHRKFIKMGGTSR